MRTIKLRDIASPISINISNPSDCGYDKFVGLEHYDSGEFVISRYSGVKLLTSAAKEFKKNDILIARRNVYLKRAGIVKFDGITSGDSIILRVNEHTVDTVGVPREIIEDYLPLVLNTEDFWLYANKHADGMNSKRISKDTLLDYEFMLPSEIEIKTISEKAWAAYRLKEAYKRLLVATDEMVKSEFMVKLKLKRGRNQFEDFKAEFCDEKKQMCERITSLPDIETVKEDNSLAISVRKNLISRNNLTAQVVSTGDDYIITVNAKRIKDIHGKITLAPIQEPWNEVELTPELQQCRVKVTTRSHLSEFYILKVVPFDEDITPVKIVIKINTTGIPEDRDDHIFRSLIDTRDKFLNYVEMMITDRPQELASLMLQTDDTISMGSNAMVTHRGNTLYESLLRIAATNPDRLEDIEDLVNRLDTKVVPDSFRQMSEMFKRSIKKLR